ncbi:MAG: hypothetical protein Q8O94_03570 [bacterium]|nr:hypothetical protein [bacterium]
MLQRSQLVDQFSLVVQQEITNHNRAVLASNVAINGIRDKVDELQRKASKDSDSLMDKVRSVENGLKQVQDQVLQLHQRLGASLQRVDKSIEALEDWTTDAANLLLQLSSVDQVIIEDGKKRQTACLLNDQANFEKLSARIESTGREHRKQTQELDRRLTEWQSMPSDAVSMRDSLLEALATNKVTVDGVARELEFIKAASKYQGKQLEDVYTQIERLS